MKKIMSIILISIFLFSSAFAVENSEITVVVNGEKLDFDVPPTTLNGRLVLPVRAIFESLGLSVGWDASSRTVIGKNDSTVITLQLDNVNASVNGIRSVLDVPAKNIDGRIVVPARFVGESLGASVVWEGSTRRVIISKDVALPETDASDGTTENNASLIDKETGLSEADIAIIDTNNNGIVTIAEAKAAGFTMPVYSSHWLYKYMIDRDGDGTVGE